MRTYLTRFISILLILIVLLGCAESTPEAVTPTSKPKQKNTQPPSASATPKPSKKTATPKAEKPAKAQWTVLFYMDADDEVLEEDIITDLNEAERVGSTDEVNLVVQIDRYKGGFKGDGNWTNTRRYYLTQDDDLEKTASPVLSDLGEVNMADANTLADFAIWGIKNYPAEHYVLVLSDHGAGWPGGWTDADPGSKPSKRESTPLSEAFGEMIYLNDLDGALKRIQKETGQEKFDLIGFDACLMAQVEVLAAVEPYANYTVFSEETEPSMGWAYTAFLTELVNNPEMPTAELAKSIVKSYIEKDQLVVDDKARQKYVERTYEESKMSASEVSKQELKGVTLTAVDLSASAELFEAIDALVQAMPQMPQKQIAASRRYALTFENVFAETSSNGNPYIDLGSFVKVLKNESKVKAVDDAADQVLAALKKVIIAEKHGTQKKGAMGLSIYFPNSKLFKAEDSGYKSYTRAAQNFSENTLWPDFLTYFYTGQPIAQNKEGPKANAKYRAPGAGQVKMSIAPLKLSSDTATPKTPVNITTTVTGDAVGYIYLFIGRYDEKQEAVQIVDIDYLDSDQTRKLEDQVYPDWGSENKIKIDMDWEPFVYNLLAGKSEFPALLEPETYGAELEDTVYTVDGYYQTAENDQERYARLFFDGNGTFQRMQVFTEKDDQGPVREVRPQKGDKFTILEQWFDMTTNNEDVIQKEGATITFGGKPITWDSVEAPKGEYVIGLIVEDLEGNTVEEFSALSVK
jgi:hypothetical protein